MLIVVCFFLPFIKKYLLKYYKKSYKSICHVKLKRDYEKIVRIFMSALHELTF